MIYEIKICIGLFAFASLLITLNLLHVMFWQIIAKDFFFASSLCDIIPVPFQFLFPTTRNSFVLQKKNKLTKSVAKMNCILFRFSFQLIYRLKYWQKELCKIASCRITAIRLIYTLNWSKWKHHPAYVTCLILKQQLL